MGSAQLWAWDEDLDDWYKVRSNSGYLIPKRPSITVTTATGTGDIDTSTSLSTDFEFCALTIHFSTGTSNTVTVTLDSNAGSGYDTLLKSVATSTTTDIFWLLEEPLPCESGDQIKVTWTNDAAYTYGLRIMTREL